MALLIVPLIVSRLAQLPGAGKHGVLPRRAALLRLLAEAAVANSLGRLWWNVT